MAWWHRFRRTQPLESELDSELRFHIDKLIEHKIATGLTPEQARREARLEFGGREQIKEDVRDVHRIPAVETLLANIHSGLRLLRKSPSFSATVILTLALGIGANTAVFSALDAVLLRPLPFPDSEQLVLLQQADRKAKNPNSFVAPQRVEDWNGLNTTFQGISGWLTEDVSETTGPLPEKVSQAMVAPRFLELWGISPALGRDFAPDEEHFGGVPAALISDRFWRRRFHADPNVLGKRIVLEKYAFSIIGVMPASFRFPDHDVDVWCASPVDSPFAQDRSSTWYTVFGRLKPGVTLAQARADLKAVQAHLGKEYPKTDANLGVDIQSLKQNTVGESGHSLWLLFGSVSLLLLIACANIAALLLARSTGREREISLRFSLGASRRSVIALLLTECLVLSALGASLGLFVGGAAMYVFRGFAKTLPRVEEITMDWRMSCYTVGCALAVTLLCGLFPAIRSTRQTIAHDLAASSRTQVSSRNPLQWVLAGVQVALAVTLLTGSSLLIRSFEELGRVSTGFNIDHVLTLRISGNWSETTDYKKLSQRIDNTLDALRALPGVRGAATSSSMPGMPADSRVEVVVKEGRAESDGKISVDARFVSEGYFATMEIPILAGKACGRSVDSPTLVVNRSFASRYFSGVEIIGLHLELASNVWGIPPSRITGIVEDAREQGLNRAPMPTVYWCSSAPTPFPIYLVRTQGEPLSMASALRQRIHDIEPARSVYNISPLREHLSDSLAENRLRTVLLTLFAVSAVSLALLGLYGTLNYFVTLRKREVGLRLALGAERNQIVTKFLMQGISTSALGCIAGLGLATAFTRLIAGMLYGVSPADTATLSFVVLLVLFAAALASLLPALRAARLEPMQVLRDE